MRELSPGNRALLAGAALLSDLLGYWEESFDRLDEYLRELQIKEQADDAGRSQDD